MKGERVVSDREVGKRSHLRSAPATEAPFNGPQFINPHFEQLHVPIQDCLPACLPDHRISGFI
jgi:hypothetical protein